MPAYQRRQQASFSTIKNEGAILPLDLLQRIRDPQNAQLAGLTPQDYHLVDLRLHEAINQAWARLLGTWRRFQGERARLPLSESEFKLTRDRWLIPLFKALDYGQLQPAKALVVGERSYAISHKWGDHTPIHLVSYNVELDKSIQGGKGTPRNSPHSLLQGLLNHSPEHLWGMVSNGLHLRILRNNVGLTGQAYLEFNLEEIFENEVYADFVLLWLLCHESRVEFHERPQECWLEKWAREAHASGVRVREDLRKNVEAAISDLGSGFLSHPANGPLREKLRSGSLNAMEYYNQVLRLVYRLLILFVAEDRNILFDPKAKPASRDLYTRYYSTSHLRTQADHQLGTRHSDLYYGLKLVMEKLGEEDGCPELGLPGLNGFLFSPEALIDLKDCQLANYALLAAIRHLAYTESGHKWRIIDYKNLGSEELGSVYESLLELHPEFHLETGKFALKSASGNARKTTGSYYTPTSLITCLLDSALDPVLNEAADKATPAEAEAAILKLKICDPACGSGHFLVAAAHRIAKKLAAVRTGDEEPSIADHRHALREVVGRCIYGVDINPMAVELCKVSLWMEAIEPGKPLSFLDAHIQCGNSLLGATPRLLKNGIPDSAFEPIEGDDKKVCSDFKKLNKKFLEGNRTFRSEEGRVLGYHGTLSADITRLDNMDDDDVQGVHDIQQGYEEHQASEPYVHSKLWADAWCAAFVWKKVKGTIYPFTEDDFWALDDGITNIDEAQIAEIQRLAKQYQFFHWHLAFPGVFHIPTNLEDAENKQAGWSGGFDVVLGNPPWEKIKLQEREWFALRRSDIANAANASTRRKMIAQLEQEDAQLYSDFREGLRKAEGESQLIRLSGRYPLCGRGDVNTYSIFAENMRGITGLDGRSGCLVPTGIVTDFTTRFFFQDLLEKRSLISVYDFSNQKSIFPAIDSNTKFCLLTMAGSSASNLRDTDFVFFAQGTGDLLEEQRHFNLSLEDILLINPNTSNCPIFRSKRDKDLTKSVYQRIPVLIKEGPPEENPWGFIYYQGIFHMSNDSHLFHTREQLEAEGWLLVGNVFVRKGERYLPLYEGKMIWHYDHRYAHAGKPMAGAFQRGSSEYLTEEEHEDPRNLPLGRYWVHEAEMPDFARDGRKAMLVFRNITGTTTNARTAIFDLIPVVPCGDTIAIALVDSKYKRELMLMASSLISFPLDYLVRQKIGGTHMNFFNVKQFPVLPPATYTAACQWDRAHSLGEWILPRSLELTYTAWDLEAFANDCGYAGPPFRWDEQRRFLLRCELDAAYFHLYGIAHEDVEYIMETFPIVKHEDEKLHGEYRTKRVILEIYDEMTRAMEVGGTYATRLVPGPADPAVAHAR